VEIKKELSGNYAWKVLFSEDFKMSKI